MAPYVQNVTNQTQSGLNIENTRQIVLLTNCYYMMLDFVLGIVKGVNERDDFAIAENYIFAIKMLDLIWRQEMNLLYPEFSRSDQEYEVRCKISHIQSRCFSVWGDSAKYSVRLGGSDDQFYSRISSICKENQVEMIIEAAEHGPILSDDSGVKKRLFYDLVKNVGDMADWLEEFYFSLVGVFEQAGSIDISFYGPLISASLPIALVSDRIIRMLKIENGHVEKLEDYYAPSKMLSEILKMAQQESKNLVYISRAYDKVAEPCEKLANSSAVGFGGRVMRHMNLQKQKIEQRRPWGPNHIPTE